MEARKNGGYFYQPSIYPIAASAATSARPALLTPWRKRNRTNEMAKLAAALNDTSAPHLAALGS